MKEVTINTEIMNCDGSYYFFLLTSSRNVDYDS